MTHNAALNWAALMFVKQPYNGCPIMGQLSSCQIVKLPNCPMQWAVQFAVQLSDAFTAVSIPQDRRP